MKTVLFIAMIAMIILVSGCATPQQDWEPMQPVMGRQHNAPVTHQFIKNK